MDHIRQTVKNDVYKKLQESSADTANITPQTLYDIGLTDVELRSYQLEGVKWLIRAYNAGIGCILADEEGLGKTCQAISFLLYIVNKSETKKMSLIVAPLSVLSHWENEFKQFAPGVKFVLYVGRREERSVIQAELREPSDVDIVLTTYEICLVDSVFLQEFSWRSLVVDEGHRLKDPQAKINQALSKLDTAQRVLLTATPLQNGLHELYTLFSFIAPQVFLKMYTEQFLQHFADFADTDLTNELAVLLKPFLLRRLHSDVQT